MNKNGANLTQDCDNDILLRNLQIVVEIQKLGRPFSRNSWHLDIVEHYMKRAYE